MKRAVGIKPDIIVWTLRSILFYTAATMPLFTPYRRVAPRPRQRHYIDERYFRAWWRRYHDALIGVMLLMPWYTHIEVLERHWCGGGTRQSHREMARIAGALLYDDGKHGDDDDYVYSVRVDWWLDDVWTMSIVHCVTVVIAIIVEATMRLCTLLIVDDV